MKANELMIGDWVYDKMLKGYGKIEVLTPFAIQCDIHTDTHHMDFFEPIPLTEEILKANEHKRVGVSKFGFPNIVIDTPKCYILKDFSYVHELQHVLRLCGLVDLADNFKVSPN